MHKLENYLFFMTNFRGKKIHPPYLLGRTKLLQNKFNTKEDKHLCETSLDQGGCSQTNTILIVWFVISCCRFFIFKDGLIKFYKFATKIL